MSWPKGVPRIKGTRMRTSEVVEAMTLREQGLSCRIISEKLGDKYSRVTVYRAVRHVPKPKKDLTK